MRRDPVRAIYDDDLDSILDRLGLAGHLRGGQLKCKVCKEVVTRDTLQALFPDSGAIRVLCNKPSCMKQLMREREA